MNQLKFLFLSLLATMTIMEAAFAEAPSGTKTGPTSEAQQNHGKEVGKCWGNICA